MRPIGSTVAQASRRSGVISIAVLPEIAETHGEAVECQLTAPPAVTRTTPSLPPGGTTTSPIVVAAALAGELPSASVGPPPPPAPPVGARVWRLRAVQRPVDDTGRWLLAEHVEEPVSVLRHRERGGTRRHGRRYRRERAGRRVEEPEHQRYGRAVAVGAEHLPIAQT